jgi:hypothetical protein
MQVLRYNVGYNLKLQHRRHVVLTSDTIPHIYLFLWSITVLNFIYLHSEMRRAVQLVETLRHKTGGCGFDYR